MDKQNRQNVFSELTSKDDLEFINNLFGGEGWTIYRRMKDEWFKAGVTDATAGMPPALTWCKHYMLGYRAFQTVMAAVAEMVVCNA